MSQSSNLIDIFYLCIRSILDQISLICKSIGAVVTYELIGKIAVFVLATIIIINVLAFGIGLYCIRKKKIVFPRFVLLTLYMFYSPLKWIFSVFSVNDRLIDEILIDLQNAIYINPFKKKSGDRRIVLLPHCLRNGECRARCDPLFGYVCKRCGRCDIDKVIEASEIYGYKVFIIPGGSFIRKILKEYKPTSCIGVACPIELSEAMVIGTKIPTQGVYLEKDGCFETLVDIDDIIEKMKMGCTDEIPEIIEKYENCSKLITSEELCRTAKSGKTQETEENIKKIEAEENIKKIEAEENIKKIEAKENIKKAEAEIKAAEAEIEKAEIKIRETEKTIENSESRIKENETGGFRCIVK